MLSDRSAYHPSCPVDANTKEWIDARASWLLDQFGRQRIHSCTVVLPTTKFFPGSFRPTDDHARNVLTQVCGFMEIEPSQVDLQLFYEGERADGGSTALGLYEQDGDRYRVWIELSLLHNAPALAAIMAHELGHAHLLGDRRVTEEIDDHEPLTDLLTVFLGLGVLTSNAAFVDVNWRSGNWEGWQVGRRGYLTMPMYGYALALFSRIREEHRPAWVKHLRLDVRDAFRRSQRYFDNHGFPELRFAQTTSARPTIVQNDAGSTLSEQTIDDEDWSETPDENACSFCGAELPGDESEGICDECQASIDENEEAIEMDRQLAEAASRHGHIALRTVFCFVVGLVLLFVVLDWLEILH